MLNNIYGAVEAKPKSATKSPFVFSSVFTSQRLVATFAMFMFAVVSTGYAAAGSLPGEFLYGLKVNVLEPAVLKMTFDEEKRQGYQVHLLHTRVSEMRELQRRAGINVYSEEVSHYATERNVKDLEMSTIANVEVVNQEVEAEIREYNSLISEPFRIRTSFIKDIVQEKIEEAVPKKNDDQPDKEIKEVEEVLEEVVKRTETLTKETEREVKKTTAAVKETADEVVKGTETLTKGTTEEIKEVTKESTNTVDEVVKGAQVEEAVKEVKETAEKATKPLTDILGL